MTITPKTSADYLRAAERDVARVASNNQGSPGENIAAVLTVLLAEYRQRADMQAEQHRWLLSAVRGIANATAAIREDY